MTISKKYGTALVIFLFSMFVVFFMITQICFWLDTKREISDVYLIQRALLKDLMFDFDNINDGDILMDKYIDKIDDSLHDVAKRYDISAKKMKQNLEITIIGKETNNKNITLQERFNILPIEKVAERESN